MITLEFYISPQGEVFHQSLSGNTGLLRATEVEMIDELYTYIERTYPTAYAALRRLYHRERLSPSLQRYRMVHRFCRCNFSRFDLVPDITKEGWNLEEVACPLRGECPLQGIVCLPTESSIFSGRELEILELIDQGLQASEIAEQLSLSIHTVNKHRDNMRAKISARSIADLLRYKHQHNL